MFLSKPGSLCVLASKTSFLLGRKMVVESQATHSTIPYRREVLFLHHVMLRASLSLVSFRPRAWLHICEARTSHLTGFSLGYCQT